MIKRRVTLQGIELPDRDDGSRRRPAPASRIINRQGRRLVGLDQAHGLPATRSMPWPSIVKARSGRRWSAGSPGIETPSPASFFDASDGFQGAFNYQRHEGTLYVAWQGGVKYLRAGGGGRQRRPGVGAGRRQPVLVVRDDARSGRPASPRRCPWPAPTGSTRFAAPAPSRCMRRPTARSAARPCWLRRWTRPDSGLGCSMVWRRSAGSTVGRSTRDAWPASGPRSGPCSKTPKGSSGPVQQQRPRPGASGLAAVVRAGAAGIHGRAVRAEHGLNRGGVWPARIDGQLLSVPGAPQRRSTWRPSTKPPAASCASRP